MLKECPTSCGICHLQCKDILNNCRTMAEAGKCDNAFSQSYMLRVCPHSCGVCANNCYDTHIDCANWARQGECYKNPGFTLKTCPRSCGVCSDGSCSDTNSTQCN